jgi:hypothetical protein
MWIHFLTRFICHPQMFFIQRCMSIVLISHRFYFYSWYHGVICYLQY